jgi:YbgC/YbaW family acyl-CoA thioester hydrolase
MTPKSVITAKQDFRFSHKQRVRAAEVDAYRVVLHAHFQKYFDTAATEYWRSLSLPYAQTMAQLGGELYVKKFSLEYFAPAHCDDLLDVRLRCARIGNSAIVVEGVVFLGDTLLVSCEQILVFANPVSQRPILVPADLRKVIEDFEAGQQVVRYKAGSWDELSDDALELRIEVFVEEQGIALDSEVDLHDPNAMHVVAYNGMGQVVATGRLLPSVNDQARVGRVAVKRSLRGTGLGSGVLRALQALASQRGDSMVKLHAQCTSSGFYEKLGYQASGAVFEEDDLAHIKMSLSLLSGR